MATGGEGDDESDVIWTISAQQRPPINYDDEDDPLVGDIRAAFATTGGSAVRRTGGQPAVVIPELARQYARDPEEAVIRNIPPHEGAEEVRAWSGNNRIPQLVDHQRQVQRIVDAQWNSPAYVFMQYLKGNLQQSGANLSNMFSLSDIPSSARINEPQPPPQTAPGAGAGAGAGPAAAGGGQFRMDLNEGERRDLQFTREVDDVLNTAGVTGRAYFKPTALAGIAAGLSALRRFNAVEYTGAKLEDFYEDDTALQLFAQLVALCIHSSGSLTGRRYLAEMERGQLQVETREKCMEIYTTLNKDERGKFRAATLSEINARRRNFIDSMRNAKRTRGGSGGALTQVRRFT